MDFRRLEVFAKGTELGSLSRAADALFLTRFTVSEHTFGVFVESQFADRAS